MENADLIAFKKRQIASLTERPEPCAESLAAIARLSADIRSLEGNADDPRDNELASLRLALAESQAAVGKLEKALDKAQAAKPAPKKNNKG